MKKILIFLLLGLCILPIKAQEVDSAQWVVDRYLKLLNYDAIPEDSTLYIVSTIVNQHNTADTTIVKRWYSIPNRFRTEVWAGDTIQYGAYANGDELFKAYRFATHQWEEVVAGAFYEYHQAYDFRGPLYEWKKKGGELTYKGIKIFNDHPVYQVQLQAPGLYDRDYFFEKETGLFVILNEKKSTLGNEELNPFNHVDWRACHEYLPLNNMLFPFVESYQTEGELVVIHNYPQIIALDLDTFNKD